MARLHHALRHEAAREKAANSEEMKAWTDRVSDISAGAACELIDDPDSELHGQRVCYCCRINLKKQKDKNATFAHRGGQQGFSELSAKRSRLATCTGTQPMALGATVSSMPAPCPAWCHASAEAQAL
eukprot:COSAG06_NODE_1898_length_8112_cov_11.078747_9_plen_127_part_00